MSLSHGGFRVITDDDPGRGTYARTLIVAATCENLMEFEAFVQVLIDDICGNSDVAAARSNDPAMFSGKCLEEM